MAFGQASGPPAPARLLDRVAELLERAGFSSFREARHPYGLTQRQAGGKFSADEASALIERLEAAELVERATSPDAGASPGHEVGGASTAGTGRATPRSVPAAGGAAKRKPTTLRELDDSVLVDELERRGWCCIAPPSEPG